MSPCSSSDLSTTIIACGVTREARARVAPVMPGCRSSSASATYCASVRPTGLSAALFARSIVCSALFSTMPRRWSAGVGMLGDLSLGLPRHDLPEEHELAVEPRIRVRAEREVKQPSGGLGRGLRASPVQPQPRCAGVDEAGAHRRDQDAAAQIVRPPLPCEDSHGSDLADL